MVRCWPSATGKYTLKLPLTHASKPPGNPTQLLQRHEGHEVVHEGPGVEHARAAQQDLHARAPPLALAALQGASVSAHASTLIP